MQREVRFIVKKGASLVLFLFVLFPFVLFRFGLLLVLYMGRYVLVGLCFDGNVRYMSSAIDRAAECFCFCVSLMGCGLVLCRWVQRVAAFTLKVCSVLLFVLIDFLCFCNIDPTKPLFFFV